MLNVRRFLIAMTIALLTPLSALAQGEIFLGINFGYTNADLIDLDSLIVSANGDGTFGPISTSALGNGLEAVGTLGYRFDGSIWAVHLSPSFYFNTESGKSTPTGDTFEYGVTAIVAMPMFRLYALENDFLSLFFQLGVGWGQVYGEINEATDLTKFSGSNIGYQAGVGLLICYETTHCLNVEGNLRVLDVERNIVDESTASGGHATGRITQTSGELEIDGRDLGVNLTGVQVIAGYVFRF